MTYIFIPSCYTGTLSFDKDTCKIENMMAVQKLGKYLPKAFIYYIFTRYFFSQLNF